MIIDKSILKNCENLSDWGDIHLYEITSGDDFWSLFYELSDYEVMCDETSNNTNTTIFNKTLFIDFSYSQSSVLKEEAGSMLLSYNVPTNQFFQP